MFKQIVVACGLSVMAAAVLAATSPSSTEQTKPVPAKAPSVNAAPAVSKAPGKPAAQALPAPKLPAMTVAQIVDRNVAAHGGLAAWRAVNTLTMGGTLDAGGKPSVDLPFTMKMKRGHKSRLEIVFHEQTAVQVFDGKQGWKLRPFLNRDDVESFTTAETRSAAIADELDGPLIDHEKKGTRVELAGTETVEGVDTYRLHLSAKTGEQRYVWIDAKTFLERKIDGEPRRMDGRMHKVAVFYRSFKTENGLTTPRSLETVVDGIKQTRLMKITKVTVNDAMADTLFQRPQVAAVSPPKK